MPKFPMKTIDGVVVLDLDAKTVKVGDQGGDVTGAIASVVSSHKAKHSSLVVAGNGYWFSARLDPEEHVNARKYAVAINTLSKGGVPSASSLGGQARVTALANLNLERRASLTPEARKTEDRKKLINGGVVVGASAAMAIAISLWWKRKR